jgi:enamine deaminase RidA (YjgF/YER057c/UK114 family)
MLTLSHIRIDRRRTDQKYIDQKRVDQKAIAPDLQGDEWLGAVMFGIAAAPLNCVTTGAALLAPAHGLIETWRTAGTIVAGQLNELRYRHDTQVLFGSIVVRETDFASDTSSTALQKATAHAYRQIFELLDKLQFRHLWRVWNFIPRINAVNAGIERYRQFNIDRSAAFQDSGRTTEGNVPAASAVGSGDDLTIYFLAGQQAPIPIENPRQLSAYRYPSEYGPRSPIFSRASLIELDSQEILFISGTASIVGHRTLHVGDTVAQSAETLLNIDAVLDATNTIAKRSRFSRSDLIYRVYLRRPADFLSVQNELHKWHGATPRAIYLQADICRADLLVEIEASAGHAMETVC